MAEGARARAFFALWPPAAAAVDMSRRAKRLQAAIGGRAARRETLHLTLAFLGEVDESLLAVLAAPPAGVAAPAFPLRLDRCGAWPRSGIGWLAPSATPPALALLHERLCLWVESLGVHLEKRAFRPHVTLVRRAGGEISEAAVEPIAWTVRHWVLVRSRLGPEGAGYEVLGRFCLPDG